MDDLKIKALEQLLQSSDKKDELAELLASKLGPIAESDEPMTEEEAEDLRKQIDYDQGRKPAEYAREVDVMDDGSSRTPEERMLAFYDQSRAGGYSRDSAIGKLAGLKGENPLFHPALWQSQLEPYTDEMAISRRTGKPMKKGPAQGIAQWEAPRRRDSLKFAKERGYPTLSEEGVKRVPEFMPIFSDQVEFLLHELDTTEKKAGDKLKDPNITPERAAEIFTEEYERPANAKKQSRIRKRYIDEITDMLKKHRPDDFVSIEELLAPESKYKVEEGDGKVKNWKWKPLKD